MSWLSERFQLPGDAVLRGLEHDLAREGTLDGSWQRVCETAWALGFIELRFAPAPEVSDLLPRRHEFAPGSLPLLENAPGQLHPQSTWAFELTLDGRPIALVTARRRLGRVDFEPMRFVAAVQTLVERFVIAAQAAGASPGIAETPGEPRPAVVVPAPAVEPLPSPEL